MSGSNHLKTYLGDSLNRFAERKVSDALQLTGKALPVSVVAVSGGVVTVQFEVQSSFTLPQVQVPVAESVYVRLPVQVGDLGVVLPADAYLGGVSGLGGGVAGLTQQMNLTALVFVPVANAGWTSVDAGKVVVAGPTGAIVETQDGATRVVVQPGTITLTAGGQTLTISSAGINMNGREFAAHVHTNVQPGSGDTGPPL